MENRETLSVAVVVLNWNGLNHLKSYLHSVVAHTPSEVVICVADNGSTDKSVSWIHEQFGDRVQVLELGENFGFAEGYNRALVHIDSDVFVLLNSDVRIEGKWIEPVIDAMCKNRWDVASPMVVQDDNPLWCEHAGAAGGLMDRDGYPFCFGRVFNHCEKVDDWHKQNREVFWASGACFFIRREAWEMAGGFDGSLFAHMEEIDLCWRLKNLGRSVGCVGTVSVRHLGGGTLSTANPTKTYLNFRNNLLVMLKNRSGFWPAFMFRRMALDGMAAWRMLLQGQWRQFLAVGHAHASFYVRLLSTLRSRQKIQQTLSIEANNIGWWNNSIVWAHFVKGKLKARDLSMESSKR